MFGVPIFLCRLFSGKLSLLFIEIHCVKILRFVSRWTEKRVFCGKTFDYGVPIPSDSETDLTSLSDVSYYRPHPG